MKAFLISMAAVAILGGCASSTSKTSSGSAAGTLECPKTGADLANFKTEKHVLSCLGKPRNETSKPDGRHTGLYGFSGGLTVIFLYDEDGNVIRNQAYQEKTNE